MTDRYDYFIACIDGRLFLLPMREDSIASYRIANPDMKPTTISESKLDKIMDNHRCIIVAVELNAFARKCSVKEYLSIVNRGSTIIYPLMKNRIEIKADSTGSKDEYNYYAAFGALGIHGRSLHEQLGIHSMHEFAYKLYLIYSKELLAELHNNAINTVEKSILNASKLNMQEIGYNIAFDSSGHIKSVHATGDFREQLHVKFKIDKADIDTLDYNNIKGVKDFNIILSFDDENRQLLYTTNKLRSSDDELIYKLRQFGYRL